MIDSSVACIPSKEIISNSIALIGTSANANDSVPVLQQEVILIVPISSDAVFPHSKFPTERNTTNFFDAFPRLSSLA